MRTITLEEHFATPGFLDGPGRELKDQAERYNSSRAVKLIEQLCDIGDKRLAEMDAAGIDMQVLSLTSPGTEQLATAEATVLANETNDYLADAIKKYPTRFGGFASLPTAAPTRPHENWSTGLASRNSPAPSSTDTIADAIWTTSSTGRSWNVRKNLAPRSICIRHRRRFR
jgi:hypothetical protein